MIGIVLELLVLVLAFSYFFFLVENESNRFRRGRMIYYASNIKVLMPVLQRLIAEQIPDTTTYDFVELGAGHAALSRQMATLYRWRRVEAIEGTRSLSLLARLKLARTQRVVKIHRMNLFDYQINQPALVYCYLSSEMMEQLHTANRLAGCLVCSLTFAIPNLPPSQTVTLKFWQSPLYIYDFR